MIIAGGCSFTHPTPHSFTDKNHDTTFPRWPELLADRLNTSVLNLGLCGASNATISQIVVEKMFESTDVSLVVVLWTDWFRLSFLNSIDWDVNLSTMDAQLHENRKRGTKEFANAFNVTRLMRYDDIQPCNGFTDTLFLEKTSAVRDLIRYQLFTFKQVETACKLLKIPFLFMQGTGPVAFSHTPDHLNKYLGLVYNDLIMEVPSLQHIIDHKHFIGWPVFESIGGYGYYSRFFQSKRISKTDAHPNAEGHEELAICFYENLNAA